MNFSSSIIKDTIDIELPKDRPEPKEPIGFSPLPTINAYSIGDIATEVKRYSRRTILRWGKYLYPERYNIGNATMFTREEARNIINCLDTYNTNVEYVSMKVQDFISLYKTKHEVKSA